MLFQKIKKGFGLSKVSTLTPADTSGLTVWLTDAKTHKIDGFTFKPFSMVQAKKHLPKDPALPPRFYQFQLIFYPKLN